MSQTADNAVTDALNAETLRADFPTLNEPVNNCRLAYLDSAASAQQPASVIEAVDDYYRHSHANVHRGVHTLSHRATDLYEGAREKLRGFINARSTKEIVFTSGATHGLNLLASSLGQNLTSGDEILITHLEHHSNIVPWQRLAESKGCRLVPAPINQAGELELERFLELINDRTRVISITQVSNALGTITPVDTIISAARERGIPVVLDGAQGIPHGPVDVQALDCDFYVFSGHKMYGPTGTGVLYGKEERLKDLPPYMSGGDMILTVSFDGTTYNELPYRFEAGTPNIAGFVGLGAAVDYLQAIGMERIAAHEQALLAYGTEKLSAIDGLNLIGTAANKAGVLSFVIDGIHPHDLGTVLDHQGVAIRTGHHCAMPVMEFFGLAGTARASLGLYNTPEDIDQLVTALHTAVDMLR